MNQNPAPYGFVPLNKSVVKPTWIQPFKLGDEGKQWLLPPVHDVPFEDGVSGTIQVELEFLSECFTRGSGKPEESFRLPDGTLAFPSSSIRGAIRNLVEIITFGRMSDVNDHRFSYRDLNNRSLYGNYMANIVAKVGTNEKVPMPLVDAGWLMWDGKENGRDRYVIHPCDFAKIEYAQVKAVAAAKRIPSFDPGRKQSAADKYGHWGSDSRRARFEVQFVRGDEYSGVRFSGRYGVARALPPGSSGGEEGTLVFTGQPTPFSPDDLRNKVRRPGKHHDFVFFERPGDQVLHVDDEVWRAFTFGHCDAAAQHSRNASETANREWGYWKQILEKDKAGARMPVFFLKDRKGGVDHVRAFGLAQMFRLPFKYSVGDSIRRVQNGEHDGDKPQLDFAQGLFGTVWKPKGEAKGEDKGEDKPGQPEAKRTTLALKGRVTFSHACCTSSPQPLPEVQTVLSGPRASYYPNYVEQRTNLPGQPPMYDRRLGEYRYRTWNDETAAPRGWKRYRVADATWLPPLPTGAGGRTLDLTRVATRFRPLPKGTKFRFEVVLHNARPQEVGALVWAMTFGGEPGACHKLGMARPLGYGRCVMHIQRHDLTTVDGAAADLDQMQGQFKEYMEDNVPDGWQQSWQIVELLALSKPVRASETRYQVLGATPRDNEFNNAKKNGWALLAVGQHTPRGADEELPAYQGPRYERAGAAGGDGTAGGPAPRPAGGGYDAGGGRPQGYQPQPNRGGPQRNDPRRFGPGRPGAPQPAPVAARPGLPFAVGDQLEVLLVQQRPNGNWKAKMVNHPAYPATVVGEAPADAAAGSVHKVAVDNTNDRANIVLRWK